MKIPKWDDPNLKAGTMVRAALWLVAEIGEGNSFTKEQLRSAFPGISQADRRVRDLRDFGWVIHTSTEDVRLNSDEQRFVSMGKPVWDRHARKEGKTNVLSSKMRREILAESDYQCVTCGIAGGERYPDAPHMSAVLSVATVKVTIKGSSEMMFVAECNRCRSGTKPQPIELEKLLTDFDHLAPAERDQFVKWAHNGRSCALDRLWTGFRRLPSPAKKNILGELSRRAARPSTFRN